MAINQVSLGYPGLGVSSQQALPKGFRTLLLERQPDGRTLLTIDYPASDWVSVNLTWAGLGCGTNPGDTYLGSLPDGGVWGGHLFLFAQE